MTQSSTPGCDGEDAPIQTRTMAQAFNEWMRMYTEEPEQFEADFRTCGTFLAQEAKGEEPSYGAICAAFLHALMFDDRPQTNVLRHVYPKGATAHRVDGTEVKIGDALAPREKITIRTPDGATCSAVGYSVSVP